MQDKIQEIIGLVDEYAKYERQCTRFAIQCRLRELVRDIAASQGRLPLTEEQVAEACGWKAELGNKPLPRELRIARAIEAAHGITNTSGVE